MVLWPVKWNLELWERCARASTAPTKLSSPKISKGGFKRCRLYLKFITYAQCWRLIRPEEVKQAWKENDQWGNSPIQTGGIRPWRGFEPSGPPPFVSQTTHTLATVACDIGTQFQNGMTSWWPNSADKFDLLPTFHSEVMFLHCSTLVDGSFSTRQTLVTGCDRLADKTV